MSKFYPVTSSGAKTAAWLEVSEFMRKIHAKIGPMKWDETKRPGTYIKFEKEDE